MRSYEAFDNLQTIQEVGAAMIDLAGRTGKTVWTRFNSYELKARPGTTLHQIEQSIRRKSERSMRKFENSKEYRESERERKICEGLAAKAAAEGFKLFTVKEELEIEWLLLTEKSSECEASLFRFVSRWVQIMERKMASGAELKDIIDESADEADTEYVDRMCYAGKFVSRYWIHSEEFDRWNTIVD